MPILTYLPGTDYTYTYTYLTSYLLNLTINSQRSLSLSLSLFFKTLGQFHAVHALAWH